MNDPRGSRTGPAGLPPLGALRCFEAAARLGSFTRAAAELHLTQSAVSHQVRELESLLGVRLFLRKPRGIALTEAGDRYLPFVREALQRLRTGTDLVTGGRATTVLTVSVSPAFAARWLVPRLGDFSAAHPDLDLRVSALRRHVELAREDIDMAVRHGDGHWPGLQVTRLCEERLYPVCSPALLREADIREAADLAHHPLLHDRDRDGWAAWLAAAGVDTAHASRGPVFNDTALAIDAAVSGQGVALGRSALASLDLAGGRLVRPLRESQPAAFAYWVVCTETMAQTAKVTRFTAWLLAQAEADRARQT